MPSQAGTGSSAPSGSRSTPQQALREPKEPPAQQAAAGLSSADFFRMDAALASLGITVGLLQTSRSILHHETL
jgi:hypothetical protein